MATQPKKFKKRQDRGSEQAEPIVDRPPPFNLEAETGVLGSLMLMPEACDEIVNILRATDFYDEAHGQLFSHIMEMHSAGKKIDMTLLRERLVNHDHYEMIGGAAGLAEIFTTVPSAAHAVYYATIVREKATMRNLISTCTEILTEAYQPAETSEHLLNRAEQKVFGIR